MTYRLSITGMRGSSCPGGVDWGTVWRFGRLGKNYEIVLVNSGGAIGLFELWRRFRDLPTVDQVGRTPERIAASGPSLIYMR